MLKLQWEKSFQPLDPPPGLPMSGEQPIAMHAGSPTWSSRTAGGCRTQETPQKRPMGPMDQAANFEVGCYAAYNG